MPHRAPTRPDQYYHWRHLEDGDGGLQAFDEIQIKEIGATFPLTRHQQLELVNRWNRITMQSSGGAYVYWLD